MIGARRFIPLVFLVASACQAPMPAPTAPVVRPSPSPSPVASPTPRPSPVPATLTPTTAPALREFTEQFDSGSPYWIFLRAGEGTGVLDAELSGGFLQLNLTAPNQWGYAVYDPQTYADVRVDAQVQLGAGGEGAAGLICRYDQAAGWYEFNIYPDQTYALLFGQWLTEGVARYAPLVISESEIIDPTLNEIGLACEGDVLTPYINGVQMRRRQEKLHVLTEGKVGVSVASSEAVPLTISYDWISVGSP